MYYFPRTPVRTLVTHTTQLLGLTILSHPFQCIKQCLHRRIQDISGGGLRDKFIRMCIDCIAVNTQVLT